jgi:4-amino-4-deoxy-L-arabinose transferase-like glycosyltransferase
MRGLEARNGGRAGLAALCAILLVALGLRVYFAWDAWNPQVQDARAYARIARSLDEDGTFAQRGPFPPRDVQQSSNYSPGLPLFVAGIYKASGGVHIRLARVVLAAIGTLAALFAYLIGRRLSGPGAGLIAAAVVAGYPALLEYQGMLMTEPLAAALLTGAVLALLWASDPGRGLAAWVLPGALLGAMSLVRPEYLGVSVLLALVVLARGWLKRDRSGGLRRAGILVLALVVVIAPWTVRNAIVLDRFVPLSTGGGQVLFAGTYLPSDGNPQKVGGEVLESNPSILRRLASQHLSPLTDATSPRLLLSQARPPVEATPPVIFGQRIVSPDSVSLEKILATLAARQHPGLESDAALSKMGRAQLWRDLRDQPLRTAGFTLRKVTRIWARGQRAVMEETGWAIFHGVLVLLGLAGLAILALRRRWEAAVIGTIFLAITAISALLVASPRRVLVLIPLVAALAGLTLVELAARMRARQTRASRPATV